MSLAPAFTALTGASAVSMAAHLLRGKLAALLLGPSGVGILNQLSLLWNLFHIGGTLGASNGIIQHGAEALGRDDQAALRRLASTSAVLLGGLACLLAAAGVGAAPLLSDWLLDDGGSHAGLVALILLSVPLGVSGQVYRALLSSARGVKQLVRAQILSDVGGALVFALLIVPLGLAGAVLGFMATHLLFLIVGFGSARRLLGGDVLKPRVRDFSWAVVRGNVGFGASGLIMIVLSNLSVLLVSRLVIGQLGLDAGGIFANSWRIASVYLGAVTVTALGYYLPTLTRCETNEAMDREVNATLRFYLYALPLVMAAIMACGEFVVWLILSPEFMPVAALLLIFVPAELLRILAESLSMPLLARRKIVSFTLLWTAQFTLFVLAAALLVPVYGLTGAAVAYAVANLAGVAANALAISLAFRMRLEPRVLISLLWAFALLVAVGLICRAFPLGPARLALCGVVAVAWLVLTLVDPVNRGALFRHWTGFRNLRATP